MTPVRMAMCPAGAESMDGWVDLRQGLVDRVERKHIEDAVERVQ